jgi:hypothetical protein
MFRSYDHLQVENILLARICTDNLHSNRAIRSVAVDPTHNMNSRDKIGMQCWWENRGKTALSNTGWRFDDNGNIYLGERGCKNRTWVWIMPNDDTGFSISGAQKFRALSTVWLVAL